jgi:hypothetical protein
LTRERNRRAVWGTVEKGGAEEKGFPAWANGAIHPIMTGHSFLALVPREPELRLLHQCFDTWRGIGEIVAGMARQEYDLELRRYKGRGWRATFFLSGFEHSLTADAGSA